MANTDDSPDPRHFGIYEGVVVDNADPRGMGRVRFRVPGLIEDKGSDWAFPAATGGGGSSQRGHWHVPEIGAEIYAFFLGGDPDKPRYMTGHWSLSKGESEVPTDVKDAVAEDGAAVAPQVKTWETERFALTFDERGDKQRVYLYAKAQGQDLIAGTALMFEFDEVQGTFALSAPSGIVIRSLGMIDIDALVLNLKGRKVLDVGGPI